MKVLPLASEISVRPQFARSVQLERDAGSPIVDAYMPTARALDLLGRIVRALDDPTAGRAWSVVGPYGSGKSSFALYLDTLFGASDAPGRSHALAELEAIAPDVAAQLDHVRSESRVESQGFIRMFATANREPIGLTLLRAIEAGMAKFGILEERSAAARRFTQGLRAQKEQGRLPEGRAIIDLIRAASAFGPVLLVIDEYGKNLEYLVDDARDGDLYILQELAEEASGLSRTPLSLVTMQHLSLEDYLGASASPQRREWGKVRGRFEDVAFVDSPQQVQRLVARVFDAGSANPDVAAGLVTWSELQASAVASLGLRGLASSAEVLGACYPLHPSALMVLPELCASYGQNERTLFSFLSGVEPLAVPEFLERTSATLPLQSVRLFDVYDYFLGNPGTIAISAASASRLFEVASRVRDAQTIEAADYRCLKAVGVLNLISQAGALRASRAVVSWALAGTDGFDNEEAVRAALDRLCEIGALTYRSFADEYRIWQGSDYDFAAAVGAARDRLSSRSRAEILERALPLEPTIAARHSQCFGSLRYFERHFVDQSSLARVVAAESDAAGLVLYPVEAIDLDSITLVRPILIAESDDLVMLSELALETAALAEIVEGDETIANDWVARREMRERSAMAREALSSEFQLLARHISYRRYGLHDAAVGDELSGNLSSLLSDICDDVYPATPIVRNEMLNRRELTSQGSKARHDLIEAMIDHATEPRLGIDGYGPERAMYEAVLHAPGIHVNVHDKWAISEPPRSSDVRAAWDALDAILERASIESTPLSTLVEHLGEPPIGMLGGPIPVLLTAWLLHHADDVAMFQDGSFQPRLSIEVVERLIKAPSRFAIRFVKVSGGRRRVLERLAQSIEPRPLAPDVRNATVLQVLAPLVTMAHSLSPFTGSTTELVSSRTAAIRDCLVTGREPGHLLFSALPAACGMKPFGSRGAPDEDIDSFVGAINSAVRELSGAYERLLRYVRQQLAARLRLSEDELRSVLSARASVLVSRTLSPAVRSFMITASDQGLDEQDWLEAVAMNVTTRPPQSWSDEDITRFDALLVEMVEAFRRVEHLYHDALDGPHDGFEVARLTRTESDGTEQGEVIWVETSHKAILEKIVEDARSRAIAELGPRAESALLAVHAESLLKTRPTDAVSTDKVARQEVHGGQ